MVIDAKVPMISVLIAVRNAETGVRLSLESLRRQTYCDFEIVVVDGASTDGTLEAIHDFGALVNRTISEPDDGIAEAWNKAVVQSKGTWLLFLNAGDLLHPDHLRRAMQAMGPSGSRQVLFCDVIKFDQRGRTISVIKGRPPSLSVVRAGGIGFGHPGSLVSRQAFAELEPFDARWRIALDVDFLLRCWQSGYEFTKFESTAYMAAGGVSDRKFAAAMAEYFAIVQLLGLVGSGRAAILRLSLPVLRVLLHVSRHLGQRPGSISKHAGMAVLNVLPALLPFSSWRRWYYRAVGFKMGKRVSIGYGFRFYRPGRFSIGAGSVINRNCLLDNRGMVEIGENVSIARGVSIYTAGHDVNSPLFEMNVAPVRVGDHAVLFSDCKLMPGVVVGRGAVVYPGAVVTQDVPDNAIVGGVPAQVLGSRGSQLIYTIDYQYPIAM